MTSNKCEHYETIQQSSFLNGRPYCRECRTPFVSSDVLEEARAALMEIHIQSGHYPPRDGEEKAREQVRVVLARIDAVLGKTKP